MRIRFLYKIFLPVSIFICFLGNAQWSKKDVEWNAGGLTSKNYRLVRAPKNSGSVKIGAVTSSKPAINGEVEIINGKRILKITMANRFNYESSWMLKSERHNAALLKHEQGHFDLNEIYTRKAFERLKDFKFTADFQNEIASIMQAVNADAKQAQQVYEDETMHGINVANQEKWNEKIAQELSAEPSYQGQSIEQELPADGK